MIFGTAPGTASKMYVIPGMSVPASIRVPGFPSDTVAITSMGFSQDANVQFMKALSSVIYVYSFGERMGTVDVNGVAFISLCNSKGTDKGGGLGGLMSFYANNSVSTRSFPLTVTLAGASVTGYVRGIRTTFSDTNLGLIGFTLSMASLPAMWMR